MNWFYCYEMSYEATDHQVMQGVFYRTDTGEYHALECPTSQSLARALKFFPVYKFRIIADDGYVWEIELTGDTETAYVGYRDASDYLDVEGEDE